MKGLLVFIKGAFTIVHVLRFYHARGVDLL